MRILVAEDSVTMRKVLQMTFAGEDAELLAVENGEQALMHGRQFRPTVAFIDASLPDVDGYELTRAIKADSELSGTPVVLMASQQNPYDEARGSAAGVDSHILKPFDSQEAIDKAFELSGSVSATTQPSMPAAARSAKPAPPPLPSRAPSSPAAARSGAPTPASISTPIPSAAATAPPAAPPAAAPVTNGGAGASVADRLVALGLTQAQVEGVLKLSAEVVERVVWEVVPDLAEAMIREELHRLTGE